MARESYEETQGPTTPRVEPRQAAMPGTKLLSVRDLTSMHVQGPNGERIGRIHDVFVDPDSLLVSYMSISTGAFGRSQALVPVSELSIAEDEHGLRATAPFSQEHLRNAPGIDDDELTPAKEDEIAAYYRDADEWDRKRELNRARQATPAPTPEIAATESVAPTHADEPDLRDAPRRDV